MFDKALIDIILAESFTRFRERYCESCTACGEEGCPHDMEAVIIEVFNEVDRQIKAPLN